jgi:predicted ribosome quality control (RQC) complex YloA/Tae2 family protein
MRLSILYKHLGVEIVAGIVKSYVWRAPLIKRSMDIVDVYAWVHANKSVLEGCYVDNIYRAKYSWLIKLRCKDEVRLLKVEPGQRIHLSKIEPPHKDVDNFARYMRAHVRDMRVESLEMPWWERVVVLKTSRGGRSLVHYIEILPRGVWAITSGEGKILYASRFEEFKDRAIKPGLTYTPPPLKGLSPRDREALKASIARGKDIVRGIVYGWGLPGYVAEEILYRAGLYEVKNVEPSKIPTSDIEKLLDAYTGLLEEAKQGRGRLVVGESGLELFTPYKPSLLVELQKKEVREYDRFDDAIDVYFGEYESLMELEARRRELEKQLENWRKLIEEQKKTIEGYKEEFNGLTRVLELIYKHYNEVNERLECAIEARRSRGWEAVKECGVSSYDQSRGLVFVEVEGVLIPLSIREPLERQVVELEKKRGELEKKIERAVEALNELEAKSRTLEVEVAKPIFSKLPPRYWYERFRWTLTRNGLLVVAGRDASQNEYLVRRHLKDEDIFLHADIHGAPATILLRGRVEVADEDILDAAWIAACYSRGWKAGVSYVDVYWVYGSQVSKSPPSGEYLGKGAFMVYGERRYVRVPLVLGVGLRLFCDPIYGGYAKVFVGSPDNVKASSLSYVIIVPGDEEPGELARTIRRILVEGAYRRSGVYFEVDVNEIQSALPGPSRIVEHGVGRGVAECTE